MHNSCCERRERCADNICAGNSDRVRNGDRMTISADGITSLWMRSVYRPPCRRKRLMFFYIIKCKVGGIVKNIRKYAGLDLE